MIKQKFKEWIKRYLPSEIIGTIAAVAVASIAHCFYKNPVIVAYAGSLGEAIGFYSTVFIQNILAAHKKIQNRKQTFLFLHSGKNHFSHSFGIWSCWNN